jgi:hypothetical protein
VRSLELVESQELEIAQLVLQNSVDSIQIHKQQIPDEPRELKVPDVLAVVKGSGRGVREVWKGGNWVYGSPQRTFVQFLSRLARGLCPQASPDRCSEMILLF